MMTYTGFLSKLEKFTCSHFTSAADADSDALDECATRNEGIAQLAL